MRIDLRGTRGWALAAGVALAVAAGALVAVPAADAAEEQRQGGRIGRGAWRGGPPRGIPAGVLQLPLRRLDLTDEQRDQVRTVIEEGREAALAQAPEMRAAREALDEAVSTPSVDEARIRALAADLGRLAGDGAVRRAQVYAAVWQLLTPEQQARAGEIEAERAERRSARRERMEERRERLRERRREERGGR